MSDVNYIKQKAIEIANNSLHKIISGVMNQEESNADCSFDTFEAADGYSYFCADDTDEYDQPVIKKFSLSKLAREERRMERKQERLNRRNKN